MDSFLFCIYNRKKSSKGLQYSTITLASDKTKWDQHTETTQLSQYHIDSIHIYYVCILRSLSSIPLGALIIQNDPTTEVFVWIWITNSHQWLTEKATWLATLSLPPAGSWMNYPAPPAQLDNAVILSVVDLPQREGKCNVSGFPDLMAFT